MGSLIETEINKQYQQVVKGERRGKVVGRIRRALAYLLKFIAAGGSLVIATGYFQAQNKHIGVAILIAVLVDHVIQNHERLLAEVQAGYAFSALRERIPPEHNRLLDPILTALELPETREQAEADKDSLEQKTHQELTDAINAIKNSLRDKDLKALQALSLGPERAAIQKGH